MKEIYVDNNWTFEEAVNNIKTLKTQYEKVLASFSYFEFKKELEFKKNVKRSIYNLKMSEWKKDKLWEYMNGYELFYVIKGIVERENKKTR